MIPEEIAARAERDRAASGLRSIRTARLARLSVLMADDEEYQRLHVLEHEAEGKARMFAAYVDAHFARKSGIRARGKAALGE